MSDQGSPNGRIYPDQIFYSQGEMLCMVLEPSILSKGIVSESMVPWTEPRTDVKKIYQSA